MRVLKRSDFYCSPALGDNEDSSLRYPLALNTNGNDSRTTVGRELLPQPPCWIVFAEIGRNEYTNISNKSRVSLVINHRR